MNKSLFIGIGIIYLFYLVIIAIGSVYLTSLFGLIVAALAYVHINEWPDHDRDYRNDIY